MNMNKDRKCPGRMAAVGGMGSTVITCPTCGNDVELFSDETSRRCSCGNEVARPKLPATEGNENDRND